jgi:hypothetical protein
LCNRVFGWRGVNSQHLVKNSGASAAVLSAAQHPQWPGCQSADGYLDDVVGGEVGGGVGGVVLQAGAPVADGGAVVGDEAAAPLAFGSVVEVGASCPLGPVVGALAVSAPGFAAYLLAAAEAGAGQGAGHRGLRRLRSRSLRWHGWQRSPGPTNGLRQAMQ